MDAPAWRAHRTSSAFMPREMLVRRTARSSSSSSVSGTRPLSARPAVAAAAMTHQIPAAFQISSLPVALQPTPPTRRRPESALPVSADQLHCSPRSPCKESAVTIVIGDAPGRAVFADTVAPFHRPLTAPLSARASTAASRGAPSDGVLTRLLSTLVSPLLTSSALPLPLPPPPPPPPPPPQQRQLTSPPRAPAHVTTFEQPRALPTTSAPPNFQPRRPATARDPAQTSNASLAAHPRYTPSTAAAVLATGAAGEYAPLMRVRATRSALAPERSRFETVDTFPSGGGDDSVCCGGTSAPAAAVAESSLPVDFVDAALRAHSATRAFFADAQARLLRAPPATERDESSWFSAAALRRPSSAVLVSSSSRAATTSPGIAFSSARSATASPLVAHSAAASFVVDASPADASAIQVAAAALSAITPTSAPDDAVLLQQHTHNLHRVEHRADVHAQHARALIRDIRALLPATASAFVPAPDGIAGPTDAVDDASGFRARVGDLVGDIDALHATEDELSSQLVELERSHAHANTAALTSSARARALQRRSEDASRACARLDATLQQHHQQQQPVQSQSPPLSRPETRALETARALTPRAHAWRPPSNSSMTMTTTAHQPIAAAAAVVAEHHGDYPTVASAAPTNASHVAAAAPLSVHSFAQAHVEYAAAARCMLDADAENALRRRRRRSGRSSRHRRVVSVSIAVPSSIAASLAANSDDDTESIAPASIATAHENDATTTSTMTDRQHFSRRDALSFRSLAFEDVARACLAATALAELAPPATRFNGNTDGDGDGFDDDGADSAAVTALTAIVRACARALGCERVNLYVLEEDTSVALSSSSSLRHSQSTRWGGHASPASSAHLVLRVTCGTSVSQVSSAHTTSRNRASFMAATATAATTAATPVRLSLASLSPCARAVRSFLDSSATSIASTDPVSDALALFRYPPTGAGQPAPSLTGATAAQRADSYDGQQQQQLPPRRANAPASSSTLHAAVQQPSTSFVSRTALAAPVLTSACASASATASGRVRRVAGALEALNKRSSGDGGGDASADLVATFTRGDEAVLALCATQCALVLGASRSRAALALVERQARACSHLHHVLCAQPDARIALAEACETLVVWTRAERCALFLVDHATDTLALQHWSDWRECTNSLRIAIDAQSGILGRVATSTAVATATQERTSDGGNGNNHVNEVVHAPDECVCLAGVQIAHDARSDGGVRLELEDARCMLLARSERVRSTLVAPIRQESTRALLGIVQLVNKRGCGGFDALDRRAAAAWQPLAAVAIEHVVLQEREAATRARLAALLDTVDKRIGALAGELM